MLTIADVIRHFSIRAEVPVEVDEVVELFVSTGIKDHIFFWSIESDVEILRGKMKHWEYPTPDGAIVSCLDVDISKNLDERWQRLVSCKELLHLLDPLGARVSDASTYGRLVEKVILPANLQDPFTDGHQVNSDRVAELQATAVLFPIAARELLHGPYQAKKLSIEDIVRLVDLPPRYVAYVMSDVWEGIHDMLILDERRFRVVRHLLKENGSLIERAVLAGKMVSRGAAMATAQAEAEKHADFGYDDEKRHWWAIDTQGRRLLLLIEREY